MSGPEYAGIAASAGESPRVPALSCSSCGDIQTIPALPPGARALCRRCARPLAYTTRSLDAALAFTLGVLVLILPANLLPLLHVRAIGVTVQSRVIDGVDAMLRERMAILAIAVLVLTVLLPIVRTSLLALVLGSIRLGRELPRRGMLFRWALALRAWAMLDVLLLSLAFTYLRITEQSGDVTEIAIGPGGICLCAAVALAYAADLSLDRRAIWSAISPDRPLETGAAAAAVSGTNAKSHGDTAGTPAVPCEACGLVVPGAREGSACPRCAAVLERLRPRSLGAASALVLAGLLLYWPSYAYPVVVMAQLDLGVQEHTIVSGITALFRSGFWYYGVILGIASIVIPLLKLVSLAWLIARARWPAPRRRALRARLHRSIDVIGRWSMMDPLVIATTVPLMTFAGLSEVHAAPAILPFFVVVVLTMLAAQMLDPRLAWRPAEEER